jgi:CubicO group peptidase (beta-lactamase class C family)
LHEILATRCGLTTTLPATKMTNTLSPSDSTSAVAIPRRHLPRAEDFLLWPPALQVYGFRIVDQLFASRTIRRGPVAKPLDRGPEVDVHYHAAGREFGIDDFMDRNRLAGLLVLHDGRVRLERYGLGLQESDRWSTMSTVKSMTAMLVGAAVHDGAMRLDDRISRFLPALANSAYEQVSVRDVMTMASGVAWVEAYDDKQSDVNRYSKSLADKVPGGVLAMMRELLAAHPPGAHWNYNTGDTYVLGAALSAATGRTLADYMSEKIWQPCGMEFDAFYTLESEAGQEIGGSRAGVALRDFGRFAGFVLDDGVVQGERVLPAGWVDAAGSMAFRFTEQDKCQLPRLRSGALEGYGYSWWIDGNGAMIANGFAGQRIYINRAERLVMVTLGAFPQRPYIGPGEHDHYAEVVLFTDALRAALVNTHSGSEQ